MSVQIITGDCRKLLSLLPDESAQCCVTSPPYFGLRDYGVDNQIGLEQTPDEYVKQLVEVFREVRRVLRKDGTLWLNLGDSYNGSGKGGNPENSIYKKQDTNKGSLSSKGRKTEISNLKPKDLIGIPWRVALALQADGWYLRSDIIWAKPNPMPESVTDRPTRSHEYIFLLSKSGRYYYDAEAIKEPAIYDIDGTGTIKRKERAAENQKSMPTKTKNGIRPLYKNAKDFNGKYQDKQRGHSRRHAGFNERWDNMTTKEQCSGSRNKRDVWNVATKPYAEAHFATFPPELIEPCILAGSAKGNLVLDPFGGSGTTGMVADRLGRNAVLIELNPEYSALAKSRMQKDAGMFAEINTQAAVT